MIAADHEPNPKVNHVTVHAVRNAQEVNSSSVEAGMLIVLTLA
jgi:hypothetical protein